MPSFGIWASDWWKPVLFVVVAGHITAPALARAERLAMEKFSNPEWTAIVP